MTDAELAILNLIAEGPRHGYEIEQVIEERNMRAWTEIGFSSIYRILKKLEQDGLVVSRPGGQEGRGPARKVYHITNAGRQAGRQASLEALATPTRSYSSFLLGLDNLGELPRGEALDALRTYLETLRVVREMISDTAENHPQSGFFIDAFFDYLLTLQDAEIRWLEAFTQRLEAHSY